MKNSDNDFQFIFTSVTRIADFGESVNFAQVPLTEWANGDFIVVKVQKIGESTIKAELANGRMMELMKGDLIIGALGVRHATLEATGTWTEVGEDGIMHILTGAGLLGKMTSRSAFVTTMIEVKYVGHVMVNSSKTNMRDYAAEVSEVPFGTPVILFVGTSMSSGKTTSARIVTRQLKKMGLKVACAKLTGAGRFRDILTIKDAGADYVYDFVDVGLPSTICPEFEYRIALRKMLALISASKADVAVVEIGASPLEPYNGDIAIKAIKDHVACTVLCASDPYAVLGVMKSFELVPSIVSGPAANTIGGIDLIRKLCGKDALNLVKEENLPKLREILKEKLGMVTKDKMKSLG